MNLNIPRSYNSPPNPFQLLTMQIVSGFLILYKLFTHVLPLIFIAQTVMDGVCESVVKKSFHFFHDVVFSLSAC